MADELIEQIERDLRAAMIDGDEANTATGILSECAFIGTLGGPSEIFIDGTIYLDALAAFIAKRIADELATAKERIANLEARLEARDARVRVEERAKVIEDAKAALSEWILACETHGYPNTAATVKGAMAVVSALHTPESRAAQSSEGGE